MQITWLDILAGNIGGAAIVAVIIFAFKTWREERTHGSAVIFAVLLMMAAGLFTMRASYWFYSVQG